LGAFGSAQLGPAGLDVAPSLLFEDWSARAARGEAKRLPLLPPPPMSGNEVNFFKRIAAMMNPRRRGLIFGAATAGAYGLL